MTTKLRYYNTFEWISLTLRVIFSPDLWFRTLDTNREHDRALVHALKTGASITREGRYALLIDGVPKLVWVGGFPHDFGSQYTRNRFFSAGNRILCSRKTVLYLASVLEEKDRDSIFQM